MAEKDKGSFKQDLLKGKQLEDYKYVRSRISELQDVRKNHYGEDLDAIWRDADRDYVPHRLRTRKGKRAVVTDEDKGLRGALVKLGGSNWQSDVSQSNPFIKIQTALSIMVDQNPSGVFTPMVKKFQATTELIHQLYKRSWEYAKSKAQLKLFVYNLAKYGWACGRTYPLRLTKTVKVLTEFDPDNPSNNVYEEKEVVEYNDIMRDNLDPRNTWIDDMAKPNNEFSLNDWCWRKIYTMEQAEKEFGKYPFWKYVQSGGNVQETIDDSTNNLQSRVNRAENLLEFYGYENKERDLFVVMLGDVPIIMEPLPIAGAQGAKKLSLWQAYWNIRHAESPYGVGIYEAIRHDQSLLDRIRNMTTDQLTLSIYKMFFYQGTQALTDTGDIRVSPGVGKQVLDPKSINWLETPGPGKDAYAGIEMFRKDVDEVSGIGDPLLGAVTGKTAFEIAQAKESALKRLKDPLNNILDALNTEGYITISLIDMMYSVPETHVISNPETIAKYLEEIGNDEELFERDPETDDFIAKIYPEFPLNLEEDEQKNLIETEDTKFFRIKPRFLKWEGIINIKSQSILTPSKQIDKALDLEMYNIIIPLLPQPPEIYSKIAKSIVKLYDKDPKEVLPDHWLVDRPQIGPDGQGGPETGQGQQQQNTGGDLFLQGQQGGGQQLPDQALQGPQPPQQPQQAPGPGAEPGQGGGFVQKLANRISRPFRGGGGR